MDNEETTEYLVDYAEDVFYDFESKIKEYAPGIGFDELRDKVTNMVNELKNILDAK